MNDTHTPSPDQYPGLPAEDQIRADRACITCGFNLYGQSVTKEHHYGLAIARCPECGTVAALQQYPAMTHWVNRFRTIIASVYIVALLGFFALSTFGVSMFAYASSSVASQHLSTHLRADFNAWYERQSAPQVGTNAPVPFWGGMLTPEYVRDELPRAMDEFGPLWAGMDPEWLIVMVPAVVVCFAIGLFWSVTLLGAPRWRAMLVPLVSCLIGLSIVLAANRPDYDGWVHNLADQLYVPLIAPAAMLIELIAIAVGVWCGRSVARGVIKLTLPTRARVPLSIFWTRDGLEPPRPNGLMACGTPCSS